MVGYHKTFFGFFQQDEWLSFSLRYLLEKQGIINLLKEVFSPSVGHFQPFNTLALQTLFHFFALNYLPYAIVSIILHLTVVTIVFYLTKIVLKDTRIAYLVTLLFGVSVVSFQATSWVLADTSIHFSTIFSLLSLLLLFKFLNNRKKIIFIWSLILLLVSLLFKEISIGFFLVFVLTILWFAPKSFIKLKYIKVIILAGFLYALFRIGMLYMPEAHKADAVVTESQPIKYLVYNIATFPFKGVSQSTIPSGALLDFSYSLANLLPESLVGVKETPDYDNFVQRKILEGVSLTFSFVVIFLSIILWWKNKTNIWGKTVIFALTIIMINTPIFALSPEKVGRVFIIDSRNLYLVTFGSSLLISSIIVSLVKRNFIKTLLIISPLLIANIIWLDSYLTGVSEVGILRKNILNKISSEYPTLPKKVVFYTNSDRSFYGLPAAERIMPFQSGFGQTLLMWYYQTERFPSEFLKNKFLWAITDQGYKEIENTGFGYFRDFDLLAWVFREQNLSLKSIIAYSYNTDSQEIRDISKEVRGRIEGFLANKQQIAQETIRVKSDYNPKSVNLVIDGDRSTFWDSKLPYDKPQYFELDLGLSKVVAEIQIDSYNNKNQNQVGYKILLSDDGKNWIQLFQSKIIPPNSEGLVKLYFQPTKARYFRIEQIGHHGFASWVIHEINLYEVI